MAVPAQHVNGHAYSMPQGASHPQMHAGPYASMTGTNGMTFSFRQRFERVDWKKLASAEVDTISRTLDFNTLQDNIMNVAFCNIESEVDVRLIDPNFLKLFKLAQLTIEYLLHSQEYLAGMVQALEEKLRKAMEEHGELCRRMEQQQQEVVDVKKESHKRKKMLIAQQHIINQGSPNNYNKCPYCSKGFVNQSFMQAHLLRRHADLMSQMAASNAQGSQGPSYTPQTSGQQMSGSQPAGSAQTDETTALLEKELDDMRERLRLSESQLTEERNARNSTLKRENADIEKIRKENKRQIDVWKQQLSQQKKEMGNLESMYQKEIKEMVEKHSATQRSLEQIQRKSVRQKSNLGALLDEDDVGTERELLQQQREEVAVLQEHLNHKLSNVEETMQAKFEDQERQYRGQLESLAAQHQQQITQLKQQLQQKERKQQETGRARTFESSEVEITEKTTTEVKTNTQIKSDMQPKKFLDVDDSHVETFTYEASPEPERRAQPEQPMKPAELSDSDVDESLESATSASPRLDELDGHTDMETTMGTTLGHTTGTLTNLSGTWNVKSRRLLEQLERNPNLVKCIKEELAEMLQNSLERRGVPRGAKGINDKELEKHLETTKAERQRLAAKLPSLYDIRQNYITQMENTAKEQYKERHKEFSASAPSNLPAMRTSQLPPTSSASQLPASNTAPNPALDSSLTASKDFSSTPKPTPSTSVPKPAPRRDPNRTLGSTISGTSFNQTGTSADGSATGKSAMSATGTSYTGTSYTGTSYTETMTETGKSMRTTTGSGQNWDSDEDEETYTETDKVDGPSPKPRQSVARKPSNATTNDDSEDVWDIDSDLDDLGVGDLEPVVGRARTMPQAQTVSVITTPKAPRGTLVASLTANIEQQLANRGKRPPGGKSTLDMSEDDSSARASRKGARRSTGDEDDDDDFSISSLEEDSLVGKGGNAARRTPVRGSAADTDQSSNTLDTSMWGSAKGGPVNQLAYSATRSSLMGISDLESFSEDLRVNDL